MKNSDSHIYLYAKNHYKITDTIEDLKKIIAERCGFNAEDVRIGDIQSILTNIAFKAILKSHNPEHFLEDFIISIDPNNMRRVITGQKKEDYDFSLAVIEKSLSVLALTRVRDGEKVLIELDEPNVNILPLKREENEKD